jgi:hypothetical protein
MTKGKKTTKKSTEECDEIKKVQIIMWGMYDMK